MTRFYVTHGTTRRSLRSGAKFAGARGHAFVSGFGHGVKLERENRPATAADTAALAAAAEKRALKAARRWVRADEGALA